MAPVATTGTDQLKRLKIYSKTTPLGIGTFAVVYRGQWDGQPCAVKVLLPKHANTGGDNPAAPLPPIAAMLKREGEALMRHPHNHLIRCLAVLSLPPTFPGLPPEYSRPVPALVLAFMDAGSLSGLIRLQNMTSWRPLYSTSLALVWASQLAAALLHMHSLSPPLLHRDVKADNVMLARGNSGRSTRLEARLGDLGLHAVASDHPRSKLQPPLLRAPLPDDGVNPDTSSSSRQRSRNSAAQGSASSCRPLAAKAPSVPRFFYLMKGEGEEREGAELIPVELKKANKSMPQTQQTSSQLTAMAAAHAAVPLSQTDVRLRARTPPYDGFSPPPGPRMEEVSRVTSSSCTADGGAAAINALPPKITTPCDGAPFPAPGPATVTGPPQLTAPRSSPSLTPVSGQHPPRQVSTPAVATAAAATAACWSYAYDGGGGGSGTRTPRHSGSLNTLNRGGGGRRWSSRVVPTPAPATSAPLPSAAAVSPRALSPSPPPQPVVEGVQLRSFRVAAQEGGGDRDDYGGGTAATLTPTTSTTRANSGMDCCSQDMEIPDDVTTSEDSGPGASTRTRSGLSYRALSRSDSRASGSEMMCIAETACGGGWKTTATVNQSPNGVKINVASLAASPYGMPAPVAVEVNRLCCTKECDQEPVQGPGTRRGHQTAAGAALAFTDTNNSPKDSSKSTSSDNICGGDGGRRGHAGEMCGDRVEHTRQVRAARGGGGGGGEKVATETSNLLPAPVTRIGADNGLTPCDSAGLYERVYCLTSATGSYTSMAPEVYLGLPYNEKADVFSFGVVLYELLSGSLLVNSHVGVKQPGLPHVLPRNEDYAAAVAAGYRPQRSPRISDPQWSLICSCWHQDPLRRPNMVQVTSRLTQLVAESEEEEAAAGGCYRLLRKSGMLPDDNDLDMMLVEDHMGCGGGGGCTIS